MINNHTQEIERRNKMEGERTLKITFKHKIPIFAPEDWRLFKKMAEVIYRDKIVSAEDGLVDHRN